MDGADPVPFFKGVKILEARTGYSGTYDFSYTATKKTHLICFLVAYFGDNTQTVSIQVRINSSYLYNQSKVPIAGGGAGLGYNNVIELDVGDVLYAKTTVPSAGFGSNISMFIAAIE